MKPLLDVLGKSVLQLPLNQDYLGATRPSYSTLYILSS